MAIPPVLICSSHTISGLLPGGPVPARHSFESRVASCAAAGYGGMCLHWRDHRALREAGYSDARLGAILREAGMAALSVEFLTGWFLTGTGPEAEAARRNEAAAFEAAAALGAPVLNVGGDLEGRGIAPERLHAAFAALCDRAAGMGLKIALEIVPWSDVPDPGRASALIEGIGNAGLAIDSWHVFRGGIALAALARIPARRILCIQISDAPAVIRGTLAQDSGHRLPCGEGSLDLDGFLSALDHASTPVSVEIISPEFAALPVAEAARRSAEGAHRLLARLAARRRSQGAAG